MNKQTSAVDHRVGDVWKVRCCRKGALTIRLTEPIDPADDFFDAELVDGVPQYIRDRRNDPERPGDRITFRHTFVKWVALVERAWALPEPEVEG